jgi:4-aminobutyrate aminotransferase-like enzyme
LIWARAEGSRVWDEHGREYIDLTGGFGVAVLGHGNPKIRAAVAERAGRARARRSRGGGRRHSACALRCPGRRSSASPARTRSRSRCGPRCSRRESRGIVAFEGAFHGTGLAGARSDRARALFARRSRRGCPGPVYPLPVR